MSEQKYYISIVSKLTKGGMNLFITDPENSNRICETTFSPYVEDAKEFSEEHTMQLINNRGLFPMLFKDNLINYTNTNDLKLVNEITDINMTIISGCKGEGLRFG